MSIASRRCGARRTMSECIEVCARDIEQARSEHSPLRAMGDLEWHADRRLWRAPAVSDTLSDALRAAARARATPDQDELAARRVPYYTMAWRCAQPAPLDVVLLPRLRRWFPSVRIPTVTLREWVRRAADSVAQASPLFGISLLRVWCDAWATSYRKGVGADGCIRCGRARSDRLSHLVRCRPVWSAAARATGVPAPANLRQALGLDTTNPMPGSTPKRRVREPAGISLLAVAMDMYHKLRERRRMGSHAHRPIPPAQIDAAAQHAMRRMWRL